MIKLTKRFTQLFLSLAACSTVFYSCTDVDKTLGMGLVPNEERRDFKVDTIYPDAYTRTIDSIYTHSPSTLVFGDHSDPMFGLTTAGCVFQLLPSKDSLKFSSDATTTSLTLQMSLKGEPIGNPSSSQTVAIYELKERVYIDKGYYANTSIKSMIESNPIATYTYSGADTLKIDLGATFASKLLSAPDSAMIFDRETLSKSKFFDYVKGLYVVGNSPSGSERINFINPNLHITHIYKHTVNGKEKVDTSVYRTLYSIDQNQNAIFWTQFNTFEHDRSKADPGEKINRLNDTLTADSVVYLQGLFGTAPYIKITPQKLTDWLQKINRNASQVAIIRAELVMELEENFNGFDITKYPSRLGGMTLLNHLFNYHPYYGTLYVAGCLPSFYYSLNGIDFDGRLNGSHKKYSFNITHEILNQLRNGKNEELRFYLTPYTSNDKESQASSNRLIYNLAPSQYRNYKAVLKGSNRSDPKSRLKLILTYAIPQ